MGGTTRERPGSARALVLRVCGEVLPKIAPKWCLWRGELINELSVRVIFRRKGSRAVRFCGKTRVKPHRGEVSSIEGRCVSIFRIIRSSVRFIWWGLSKWSRFHSERFPAFFCFFQKTRKNAFWGGNLKIILRSGDVYVKMTGSGKWIFEIWWGLSIFGEVYHTMRFYDKRWGFDHPMMFMFRWGLPIFGDV